MKKLTFAATALALATAAPLSAQTGSAETDAVEAEPAQAEPMDVLPTVGDEISDFRSAGAWKIRQNTTRGSCFASYRSEAGAIVQFGLTHDEQAGYLGLFSQLAEDVAAKQEIAVLVNGNLYVGEAHGVGSNIVDGYKGGYILVNNPEFVADVEQGKELVAFPETPETYAVDMSGASNAVYEVRKCTRELQAQ